MLAWRTAMGFGAAWACALVAACGGSSGSGPGRSGVAGTSSGSTAGGSCKAYTACNLLSSADVATALATNNAAKESDLIAADGSPRDSAYVCEYGTYPNATMSLTVSCIPSGFTSNQAAYQSVAMTYSTTPIPVTIANTDAAFYLPEGGDGGLPGDLLIVFAGTSSQFALTAFPPSSSTIDPQAALVHLAGLVVPNL